LVDDKAGGVAKVGPIFTARAAIKKKDYGR